MFFSCLRKKNKAEKYEDDDVVSGHEEIEDPDIQPLPPIEEPSADGGGDIYDEVADGIGIDANLMRAFVKVETNGNNLLDGRAIIRWETHIFKRRTNYTIKVHGKRGYINKECQDNEWEAFTRARDLLCAGRYSKDAYESASWGIGQIMGFHYKRLGFDSPKLLAEWISESEENGIRSIGMFIGSHSKLLQACRDRDFAKIAYYYNGQYYARNRYDEKMREYYEELTGGADEPASEEPNVDTTL